MICRFTLLILVCLLSGNKCLVAQKVSGSIFSKKNYLPLVNGSINEELHNSGCLHKEDAGLIITSSNDSCFSVTTGKILCVVDLEDFRALIVKASNSQYLIYNQFESVAVKNKDSVKRGDLLGRMIKSTKSPLLHELELQVYNRRNEKYMTSKKLLEFLMQHNKSPLKNHNVPVCDATAAPLIL